MEHDGVSAVDGRHRSLGLGSASRSSATRVLELGALGVDDHDPSQAGQLLARPADHRQVLARVMTTDVAASLSRVASESSRKAENRGWTIPPS